MARLKRGLAPLPRSNVPKRARSSYFLVRLGLTYNQPRRARGTDATWVACRAQFCDEERQKLKGAMTKFSMSDLSKTLSHRWKQLTPAEKQPYLDRSKQAKVDFVLKWGDNTKKGLRLAANTAVPPGWKLIKDAATGAPLYLNTTTKRCSWSYPESAPLPAAAAETAGCGGGDCKPSPLMTRAGGGSPLGTSRGGESERGRT
jgi:hypothetical protein